MLLALASLLVRTKRLFRPSLECMMGGKMLLYRIRPSQAHQRSFKWRPPVSKPLVKTLKLLFVYLPLAISSFSSLLVHFFIFFSPLDLFFLALA